MTPDRTTRVVAFPYAGAHTDPFHPLRRALAEQQLDAELTTVVLPGHGRLLSTDPLGTIEDMADWSMAELDAVLGGDDPVVLMGYSMGSLVAFEVARRMLEMGRVPAGLLVNGATPPHLIEGSDLDIDGDDELVEHCTRYGIMAPGDVASPAIRQLFLPALRRDIQAVDRYACASALPLLDERTSVTILTGDIDDTVHDVPRWSEVTSGPASLTTVPGGHFFLSESSELFLDLTVQAIEAVASATTTTAMNPLVKELS